MSCVDNSEIRNELTAAAWGAFSSVMSDFVNNAERIGFGFTKPKSKRL